MVLAAAMGLAGLLSLARRGRPRAAPGSDAHRLATALLALVALASAANYFLLGRHPTPVRQGLGRAARLVRVQVRRRARLLPHLRVHAPVRRAAARRLPRRSRAERPAHAAGKDPGAPGGRPLGLRRALQSRAPRRVPARPRLLPEPARAPAGGRLVHRQRLQPVAVLHRSHLAALPAGAELPPAAGSFTRRRRARAAPVPAAGTRLRRPRRAARGNLFLHELLEPVRLDGRLDPALRLSGPAAGRGGAGAARAAARRGGGARPRNPLSGVPGALRARTRARGRPPRAARAPASGLGAPLRLQLRGHPGGWASRSAWPWCLSKTGASSRPSSPCTERCSPSTGWGSSCRSCSTGRSRRAAGSRMRRRSRSCTNGTGSIWPARELCCSPRSRWRRSCARSSSRSCSRAWRSTSPPPCTTTSRRWSCSSSSRATRPNRTWRACWGARCSSCSRRAPSWCIGAPARCRW